MTKLNVTLLTGIPRSGTTLSCSLINRHTEFVALHEPIQPKEILGESNQETLKKLKHRIVQLWSDFRTEGQVDNGDRSFNIDNPIGGSIKNSLRQVCASRGKVAVDGNKSTAQLFIKQNAMFTALLDQLEGDYRVIAIIRNPVDVLISWLSVDLPVNQGRLPAGEKLDNKLNERLKSEASVFSRQCIIYKWFIDSFRRNGVEVISYEEIVATHGHALFRLIGISHDNNQQSDLDRVSQPSPTIIDTLLRNSARIRAIDANPYYSERSIIERLAQLEYSY